MRDTETFIKEREKGLAGAFSQIEETAYANQRKVLEAFQRNRVAAMHFMPSTGYGYGDAGRETLGRVYADAFGGEAGLVSPLLASGTHALTVALFGILRTGGRALCVSGMPYDTLRGVIWGKGNGSLEDYGISFDVLPLREDGGFDEAAIRERLSSRSYDMVYIQRSRGYELRDAFSPEQTGAVCSLARECGFGGCIFVDNCYGEFVREEEPLSRGADLIVGSLIKNPGGGLAPTGGYIAGREKYVRMAEARLTAPSVGAEIGSYAPGYQYYYQGFFMAPHTVGQALKGSMLIGRCMEALGYESHPGTDSLPNDITRAISFDTEEKLCAFIQAVQDASPVDSFVRLEAWDMPGYSDKVIMAAGTFVNGASIELSADAPIRRPYTAYFQGGLTYEHCRYALSKILENL